MACIHTQKRKRKKGWWPTTECQKEPAGGSTEGCSADALVTERSVLAFLFVPFEVPTSMPPSTHTPLRSFSDAAEPSGQTLSPLGSLQALCDPPAPPLLLCLPSPTLCLVQAPGLSLCAFAGLLTQPSALPSYEPHPHASSMSPLEKVLHPLSQTVLNFDAV